MDREQFLEVYRHSLAHILAKAVMEIFDLRPGERADRHRPADRRRHVL